MKLPILPLLVAGAGIAQHVSASPIRVIVTEVSSNMRLGHAMANAKDNNPHVAHLTTTVTQVEDAGRPRKSHRPHHLCGGAIRAKAIAISNAFRQALGFPIIEAHPPSTPEGKEIHGGLIRIMPFTGTPLDAHGEMQLKPEHGHRHQFKHGHGSFLRRIHHALMALGPWEGRAVAFVIGCGLGVLMRMVWVMAIVTYRMIRGQRDEDIEYTEIVFEHDAENLVVSPPQYSDEKVEVVDNKPATV
ncbi:hypothetical protein PILCRDRAFT_819690 [Piloderma croceum F 1598]|uniref:Protein BIG1 n=1 Tax=Piloderma croceum (strain F 1598) TaxID=765440 RepID=A0A0C3BAX4_PILCF|nr:hypothetical protein PILCRDRAFT_819690 [Piloderma croceum F 1598]